MANNMDTVPAANVEDASKQAKKTTTKPVWTDIMTEQLIDSYQEHECLWNMTIADYKDIQKRALAFEAIDKAMDVFGVIRAEFTSKWSNLRSQFLREYNKHRKSIKSGSGTADVYHPTWKWYASMKFLSTGEVTLCESSETGLVTESTTEEPPTFKKHNAKVKADMAKKRMELLDKSIAFLTGGDDQQKTKATDKENSTMTTAAVNEEEAYGQFITNTLNRFDPYQRMFAKKRIGDVLFEIELSAYSSLTNSTYQASYPNIRHSTPPQASYSTPPPTFSIPQQPEQYPRYPPQPFTMTSPVNRGQLFQHMQQQKCHEQQQQQHEQQQQQQLQQPAPGYSGYNSLDDSVNGQSTLSPSPVSPAYETQK